MESVPLPMLRHAHHVADHLRCSQTRDQTIFGDLEGEILAPLISVKPRLPVRSILSGLIRHHVIFAADAIGERIVVDRRGG